MTDSENGDSLVNRLVLGSRLLADDPAILERLAPMPPEEADELVRRFLAGEEH